MSSRVCTPTCTHIARRSPRDGVARPAFDWTCIAGVWTDAQVENLFTASAVAAPATLPPVRTVDVSVVSVRFSFGPASLTCQVLTTVAICFPLETTSCFLSK